MWLCYTQPFTTAATTALPVDRLQLLETELSVKSEPSSLGSNRAGITLAHIPNSWCVRKFHVACSQENADAWQVYTKTYVTTLKFHSVLCCSQLSLRIELKCVARGIGIVLENAKLGMCHYTHVCCWQHLGTYEGKWSCSFVSHKPISCSKMISFLWNSKLIVFTRNSYRIP
jgi:hypothetical protein